MPTPTKRTEFINVDFDQVTMDQLLETLRKKPVSAPFEYVVTPNVDHMVRLDRAQLPAEVRSAYETASICVCDSRVVSRLAKFAGIDLPVVPGSDLTRRVMNEIVQPGDRVAIIGGDASLLQSMRLLYPHVEFLQHEPPMGLMRNAAARREAATFAACAQARFVIISVGSPQQELIAAEIAAIPETRGTALCVGAALEFIVGTKRRAPDSIQHLGLEWAHRLLSEPRRMWRRYLVEGPRIFAMAYRWSRKPRLRA